MFQYERRTTDGWQTAPRAKEEMGFQANCCGVYPAAVVCATAEPGSRPVFQRVRQDGTAAGHDAAAQEGHRRGGNGPADRVAEQEQPQVAAILIASWG